jgi:hypothetical protein
MFVGEAPAIDLNIISPCQSASGPASSFKDQWLESAFGEVEGGSESGNSPPDNDGIVVVIHWGDYMSE